MATIIDIMKRVCPVIGLERPSAVYGSTTQEHIELAEVANDAAAWILKDYDWQLLIAEQTMTGDGIKADFDLPADYDRMLKTAEVWSSAYYEQLEHVPDINDWLGQEVRNFDYVLKIWTIFGNQMHIKPAMDTDETAKYIYISNLIISPASGENKTLFDNDTDSFRLDDDLLRLAIIWQWKSVKKNPYAEELANYEAWKDKIVLRDKGARIITQPSRQVLPDVRTSYPRSITP